MEVNLNGVVELVRRRRVRPPSSSSTATGRRPLHRPPAAGHSAGRAPPPPPPAHTSRGREGRGEDERLVPSRGFVPRGKVRGLIPPPQNDRDRVGFGRGKIPPGYNRTRDIRVPGFNPRGSNPGKHAGISARTRPGWAQPNKPSVTLATTVKGTILLLRSSQLEYSVDPVADHVYSVCS